MPFSLVILAGCDRAELRLVGSGPTKRRAVPTAPGGMSHAAIGLSMLRQIQSHMKNFVYLRSMVRTATFVPEQTIEVAGKTMSCIVITTEGEMPDAQSLITIRLTFWIDKHTKLIRKSTQRSEGELTAEPGPLPPKTYPRSSPSRVCRNLLN